MAASQDQALHLHRPTAATAIATTLIDTIPDGATVTVKLTAVESLSASDKTQLQQLNPTLLQRLGQKDSTAPNPLSAKPLFTPRLAMQQIPLYLLQLQHQQQRYTAISTEHLEVNTPLTISRQGDTLLFKPLTQNTLAAHLKSSLPRQGSVSQLQQLTQALQRLPPDLQQLLTGRAVVDAIKPLTNFHFTDNTLSTPLQLKKAILQSGIFLENTLSQASTPGFSKQLLTQDLRTHLDKLQQQLALRTHTTADISFKQLQKAVKILDKSGAFSHITEAVSHTMTERLTSTSPHTHQALTSSAQALLQLLGIKIPQWQATQQALTLQLQQAVKQQLTQSVEHAQARIQLQQLRVLVDTRQSGSTQTPRQQWYTELPLRFNEQILPLQINLQQQQPIEENDSDETAAEETPQTAKKTVQRWQVLLSFELPGNEKLHAQLQLTGDALSATLWAESQALCRQTQQQLQSLRQQLSARGLQVEQLHCLEGKPPQTELSLGYHLVDVTT